jgi:alpha-mannosidase
MWKPLWNNDKNSLLVHNMPFDMYFVEDACGPHRDVCKKMDFRWFFYNFDDATLQSFADTLMEEYSRSASLFPHNVFLSIVGGDFRYDMEYEFDVQYSYMKIAEFVNSHPERYNNAKIQFGTPKDYFKLVRERTKNSFPSLVGDFFPYADVFTTGKPQYWTGYFTTRPYIKIISRELEHNLRNAEILYTLAYNQIRQKHAEKDVYIHFKENYENIVNVSKKKLFHFFNIFLWQIL